MFNKPLRCGNLVYLVLVTVLFLSASMLADEATRWWTWNGFMTEATFISTNDDGSVVKLRKVSGKEVDIAVARLSDEDKRYVQEHHLAPSSSGGGDKDDYFIFYGERLKKSDEIIGVRLGDEIKNYSTGKWVKEYEIKPDSDGSGLLMIPKDEQSPVTALRLGIDSKEKRVEGLVVIMKDSSPEILKATRSNFSAKYKYSYTDKKGDPWYTSKTEPTISICATLEKNLGVCVFYLYDRMYELEGNVKGNTRNGATSGLNL